MRFLLFLALIFLVTAQTAYAVTDPLAASNNRFGIHVVNESDLEDAAKLVNSSGGEWGYVKLVITEAERDQEKWQAIFDHMRELKLIPIVRIATRPAGSVWEKPEESDIREWADFLGSLNWVVQNRYVVIFNEPNHSKEWGGTLDPEGYAAMLKKFSQELKAESPDFFILPAGLDASAPNGGETMDEYQFVTRMATAVPDVFTTIDGWSSHSYPNPGFVGGANGFGRGTVRTFVWEKSFWHPIGITKNLPVFITETGWAHTGSRTPRGGLAPEVVAAQYETAFGNAWTDPSIAAVVPFILNYQDAPFDQFSFRKLDSPEFHPQFAAVGAIPKVAAEPEQLHAYSTISSDFPHKLVTKSHYRFHLTIENIGQSILTPDQFHFNIRAPEALTLTVGPLDKTSPFHHSDITLTVDTLEQTGPFEIGLQMMRGDKPVGGEIVQQVEIVPPPNVFIKAKMWFKQMTSGDDFTFLVYENGDLKKKVEGVSIENGTGEIAELRDVVPGQEYRFVLLKPFYLPQQVFAYLKEKDTTVEFPRLLPFDFNNDGAATVEDITEVLMQSPFGVLSKLLF